ncbi:tRNA lysidine(34) synthetase TilS [Neisseria zalophi]|nr:tRNA lysidine(34) synthetase TilS [Neisseria zalophi]
MKNKMNKGTSSEYLPDDIRRNWPDWVAGARIEIGLSGGLDSVVLLHLLAALRGEFDFTLQAVHVHHGLNEKADEWVFFCTALCSRLSVPLRVEYVDIDRQSQLGIEAAARKARYRIFSDGLCDIVALAHHQDDQVETFMLAALRGGGLRALAAMPETRPLTPKITIWRPLLHYSREQLEGYANKHGLDYMEDSSNQDSAFLRNWLRHQGLPVWRKRLPHLDKHIIGSVRALQDELALLDEVVQQDFEMICEGGFFDLTRWKHLSVPRRRQQLLHYSKLNGLGVPTPAGLADFTRVLETKRSVSAEWPLPKGKIYAYRDRLFALENGWDKACLWLDKSENQSGQLKNLLKKNNFTLERYSLGISEEVLNNECIIRAVSTEDVIETAVGHKNVWKVLQEHKVPTFMRKHWPVVINTQNQCIAIANIMVSVHYASLNGFIPYFDKFNRFVLEPK